MLYTVTVSFGQNSEYEFKFLDKELGQLTRETASHWLHGEFEKLECAPRNPIGKILLLDMILDVAKYGGEDRFAKSDEWSQRYAKCCAAALQRDTIFVDVPNLTVR